MLALARANVYNFLAAVYAAPPTREMIASLLEGTVAEALAGFQTVRPQLDDLEQELIGVDRSALAEALAVEHRRLFVGPGPGFVPPYQSVYTDRQTIELCGMPYGGVQPRSKTVEGLLWGESTVAAAQCYREAGVEPIGDLARVPDHLALELQFMQHLCSREAAARHAGRCDEVAVWVRRQHTFVTAYLASWIEVFSGRVMANAGHPWYRAIAAATAEFVADEVSETAAACAELAEPERAPCSA